MDNDTQKIISDQIAKLPAPIRNAIASVDYPAKLEQIAKDNKLMLDKAGKLETETTLVMLGLEPLADYLDNLQNNAGLTKNEAIAVAHDVNETIFKSIREALQKMNDETAAADASGNAAPKGEWVPTKEPSKEEILSGIEHPEKTQVNLIPEIAPEAPLPSTSVLSPKQEPYHENVSPVANIVATKMSEPVIVPKEKIVVEEKAKLPERKLPVSSDPYREPLN